VSTLIDLRRALHRDDAHEGRRWQRLTHNDESAEYAMRREFERQLRVAGASDRIILGRGPTLGGPHDWFGLPLGGHTWIHGSTGSGKSFEALSVLLQLVRRRHSRVYLFDFKPELIDLVMEAIRALVARGETWLLHAVQHLDLFGPKTVPLRVTVPEPGVPRSVQAMALATSLEETVASDLGIRMLRTFVWLTSLAIELGCPLTDLARWLRTPALFQEMALRSRDPELREYAASSFGREQRTSLEAIAARLDLLLFLPQLRAALEAPGCLDMPALNRTPGLTLVRIGGAPAGAGGAERLIGSLLMGLWSRSVLAREIEDDSVPVVGCFDEGQLAIRSRDVDHFSRFATLARSRRGTLVFLNQQISQLDSGFARVLRTNANLELAFRSSPEDAATLAGVLPLAQRAESEAGAKRALIRTLSHLPNRTFVLWVKSLGHAALLHSPRIDLETMRRDAGRLAGADAEALFNAAMPVRAPAAVERLTRGSTGDDAVDDQGHDDDLFPRLG
jgi:hypothetical protein